MSSSDGKLATGVWGGEHLGLTVTADGARLEFDCGAGDITVPLIVDNAGRLSVDGVYIREHPGRLRVDEVPERTPARYTAQVTGNTMTLDVTLTESNESLGTFTLTHGENPRVRKCR